MQHVQIVKKITIPQNLEQEHDQNHQAFLPKI